MIVGNNTRGGQRFAAYIVTSLVLGATGAAYDGWDKSNQNINDPGLIARFLWEDTVEDGNTEHLLVNYDGDHLAAVVANLNYAAWKPSYAAGDFDGNGCLDLAIGIPYASVDGIAAAGHVRVMFFRPSAPAPPPAGWTTPGPQVTCTKFREEVYSMGEADNRRRMYGKPDSAFSPQKGGFVGFSLAAGDFNCDGRSDLAVGAPGVYLQTCDELMPCERKGGGVFIGYGRAGLGLDFHQEPSTGEYSGVYSYWGNGNVPGKFKLPPVHKSADYVRQFALHGFSLAAGHFFAAGQGNKCEAGLSDLAIGAPGQDLSDYPLDRNSTPGAGKVTFIKGTPGGLDASQGAKNITEADFGTTPADGHTFGFSLAAGKFTSTGSGGYHSLAIGAPGHDYRKGRVYMVNSSALGPAVAVGVQRCLSQGGGGGCLSILGGAEDGDRFGFSVAAADFNGDGFHDLAIGIPGERIGGCCRGAGAVGLARGSAAGLTPQSENLYFANAEPFFNLGGARHEDDAVGFSLAPGDFNGDGFADLAIGVPGLDVNGSRDAGAVVVKFGGCQNYPNCNVGNHQGLSANGNVQRIDRASASPLNDLNGPPNHNELVGAAMLAMDLDRNGRTGLVIGAPGQSAPDPAIMLSKPAAANDFRIYPAQTYFVPGRFTGLDATFQQELRAPRTDAVKNEAAAVLVPKLSNPSIPFGIIDLFNQMVQAAVDQYAPKGTATGTPRFAVVDSLVPHPPADPNTYSLQYYFENVIRFYVPVTLGPINGAVRGYLSARLDENTNSIAVFAAWEPSDFSSFLKAFAGGQIEQLNGYRLITISGQQLAASANLPANSVKLTHVQILPSLEIEVGVSQ